MIHADIVLCQYQYRTATISLLYWIQKLFCDVTRYCVVSCPFKSFEFASENISRIKRFWEANCSVLVLQEITNAKNILCSMLLEARCGVHSELAVIMKEEGDMEASRTHLQKAMMLDNGTQKERLSSAFQLLQLGSPLHQTPDCPEGKAAMLMQQVSSPSVSLHSPLQKAIFIKCKLKT